MANVYAIKSGNWSDSTVWNTGTLPTSSDDVFSNGYTVTIDQNVTVLSLRNTASSPIVAEGTFVLSDSIEVTVTNSTKGLFVSNSNNSTLLSYSGEGSSTLIANFLYQNTNTTSRDLYFNGLGILNIVGNVTTAASSYGFCIVKDSTGVLNISGNISMTTGYASAIRSNGGTVNINGDCSIVSCIGNNGILIGVYSSNINITGNLYLYNCANRSGVRTLFINNLSKSSIIGSIICKDPPSQTGDLNYAIENSNGYCSIVGSMVMQYEKNHCYLSLGTTGINLFSGPFVCSPYGNVPFLSFRAHLIPISNTYFEFRDETTQGVSAPREVAPPTRMVLPNSLIDSPTPSNVRYGISYALGSQTGTLRMPSPSQVSYGIPVDNTTGSALLKPSDVWDYLSSNIMISGSIGARLKNVSTVQSTGDQLASLL